MDYADYRAQAVVLLLNAVPALPAELVDAEPLPQVGQL